MQKCRKYLTIELSCYKDFLVLNKLLAMIVVILCSVISAQTYGARIEHLNEGQIIVTDQSTSTQKRAGKRAFQQVVVKLSGDANVLENTQVKRAATNFEQYLVSSTFVQDMDKLVYQVEFSEQKVIELLRSENLNIWGNRRPTSLFWLAIEDDLTKNKTLVTQSSASEYLDVIKQASYNRGLELVMPIGDLTDSMNVSTMDVWGLFSSSIFNNSTRYGTNYVIGARLGVVFDDFSASEKLELSYFITNGQTIETSKLVGNDMAELIAEFVDEYANYLASLYSVGSELDSEIYPITLNIAKVDSLVKYRKVLEILSSLAVTQNVELSSQSKDIASFTLLSNVPVKRLKTILKLEQSLLEPEYQRLNTDLVIDYELRGN
jgi:hypothetical protein